jgi:eukaryotic-like serine/threonine-protein kinase
VTALDLRRQAAEQFVMAANFDAATETLHKVLASVGMRMPSSRVHLVVMLLVFRALLWARGTRFALRDEASVPKAALVRLDTCSAVARVFSVTDPLLGAYFQARFLLLALRCGEAYRLAYALCLEGAYRAVRGVVAREHAEDAFARAAFVARVSGSPRAGRIVAPAMRGFAAVVQGRDEEALDLSDRAAETIQSTGPGLYWALRATQLNALWALGGLGELKELSARLTRAVDEAIACGDVWTATTLRAGSSFTIAWLCCHQPDEIRGWIETGVSKWTRRVYHNQHLFACWALVLLDLYDGRGREAYDRVEREFPRARRALKFEMEVIHLDARVLRARAALLAAVQATGDDRTRLARAARRDARWIRRKGPPHARHLAAAMDAELADLQGDRRLCVAALEEAIAGADALPARLVGAAARIRLGLLRGEEGRAMVEAGERFMRAQGVVDPVRLASVFAPGLRAARVR